MKNEIKKIAVVNFDELVLVAQASYEEAGDVMFGNILDGWTVKKLGLVYHPIRGYLVVHNLGERQGLELGDKVKLTHDNYHSKVERVHWELVGIYSVNEKSLASISDKINDYEVPFYTLD